MYSNYKYDESRELSYAPSTKDVLFYYPCVFKRKSIIEPWMLPEVEQMFIWLTYSLDFDLLLPINLEELKDCGDKECCNKECSDGVFHQLNLSIYETIDLTPGKPRYYNKKSTPTDKSKETSLLIKNQTVVGARIRSGKLFPCARNFYYFYRYL